MEKVKVNDTCIGCGLCVSQKEEYFEPTNENIEDRAFDILNNSELSTEEKLTELDMIFNDNEKYSNFVLKYVYSNGENNGKTYRWIYRLS